MILYTTVVLQENNKYYLKTGNADFISDELLSKIQKITAFIQKNLYEAQIIWHYDTNTPLFQIHLEGEKFSASSPYLKFLYCLPLWQFKLNAIMNSLAKEFKNIPAVTD